MKSAEYLPDSCIWIDYFKKKKFEYGDTLEALIGEDRVYTC